MPAQRSVTLFWVTVKSDVLRKEMFERLQKRTVPVRSGCHANEVVFDEIAPIQAAYVVDCTFEF